VTGEGAGERSGCHDAIVTTSPQPIASVLESPDGRQLLLTMSGEAPVAGDLVEVTSPDNTLIGYVEEVGEGEPRRVSARLVSSDGGAPGRTRQEVTVAPAPAERVAAAVAGPDPRLHLGHVVGVPEAPVGLLAGRMNRHTF